MIQIAIDDAACVGCAMCADICPTEVFSFDEATHLPAVDKVNECFGCLSCSEICPSACIDHDGIDRSECHYHDPYALNLARKLAADVSERFDIPDDEARRAQALEDLGLRLRSVAEVFKRTLGGSLPAVGSMAGKTLARHLPRYRAPKNLDEALELTVQQFAPAWELEPTVDGEMLTVNIKRCFVREVCAKQRLELGEEMCVLFLQYLSGYVGKMGGVRLRKVEQNPGDSQCCYQLRIYA
jgi:NAD-dependent dihydropyrimidine dehydrogenase PreA subunit